MFSVLSFCSYMKYIYLTHLNFTYGYNFESLDLQTIQLFNYNENHNIHLDRGN